MGKKYLDKTLPVNERVEDLLSMMTLEEKIIQLNQEWVTLATFPEVAERTKKGLCSSYYIATSCWAGNEPQESFNLTELNKVQRAAVENTRLGIPIVCARDVIHGSRTGFPIPLALASSWDADVIRSCGEVMAEESVYDGVHWTFGPMLDMSRDPRWGRIAESPGEDTCLGAMFAKAIIDGIQGDDVTAPGKVAACAKHYIGYGASEGGRDYSKTEISDYALRNYYLKNFKAAVDAGVMSVMSSFNEIAGQPLSSSPYHIKKLLKEECGFKGMVISDWDAIGQLVEQQIAKCDKDAAENGIKAGIDMDMGSRTYYDYLKELVKEGRVPVELVDDAVRKVLEFKFKLGLFENPYFPEGPIEGKLLTFEFKEKALLAAESSMVLLKNENGVLPLDKNKKVLVSGPFANNTETLLGCWAGATKPEDAVSLIKGMWQVAGNNNVIYKSSDKNDEIYGFGVYNFTESDTIVLALGEGRHLSGEARSVASIEIRDDQIEYARYAKSLGKKVVAVVFAGRPLAITDLMPYCDAVLWAWHPGTMGGLAAANILYGEFNPCGKLSVTLPRCTGQIPIYYNAPSNARCYNGYYFDTINYADTVDTPLYPFGYGKSYTTFEYSDLTIDKNEIELKKLEKDGKFKVKVTVKNTGKYDGYEIVQLYVNDLVSTMTRPIKELKAFEKVFIKKGKSKTVTFTLDKSAFNYFNGKAQLVIEPGEFEIQVGTNCVDIFDKVVVEVK